MNVELSVEFLAGESEVLGENLPPLRPSQIPHDLSRARSLTAAVGSRRLTALCYGTAHAVLLIDLVLCYHDFISYEYCRVLS
jgi:hypothetical protein